MPLRNLIIAITLAVLLLSWQHTSVTAMVHKDGEQLYLWANNLSRKANDPPYLSLYYRLRETYFSLAPHASQPIVFLGDSITDEGDWSELFPALPVENRGIGGDTTLGVLNRLHQVIALQPSQIFLMIGTNDLCFGRSIPDTIANYRQILTRLHAELPNTRISIQSVLPFNDALFPSNSLRTNANIKLLNIIQKLAQAYHDPYIDLTPAFSGPSGSLPAQYTSDGLHLNAAGYLLWREQIKYLVLPQHSPT